MERFSPVLLYPWSPSTFAVLPPLKGLGWRMRSTPLATMPLPPRPEAKRFVAKTHSFTRRQRLISAGRERQAGRISRSLAEASVGCVSHLSRPPRRAFELADTRLHQLRNCKTARRAGPPMGCPRLARSRALRHAFELDYRPLSSVSALFGACAWRTRRPPSEMVEPRRIELLTPCVQGRCSPS